MAGRFFRRLDKALERIFDRETPKPGGSPGQFVPTVDTDDLKAVWEFGEETRKHEFRVGATEIEVFESLCNPGADVKAVVYRAQNLALALTFAQEKLSEFGKDKLFEAAAKVPMEWMGAGIVRQGFPYDFDEFLRLCASEKRR